MFSLPFVLSNLDVQGCIGAKHISFQLGAMVHLSGHACIFNTEAILTTK